MAPSIESIGLTRPGKAKRQSGSSARLIEAALRRRHKFGGRAGSDQFGFFLAGSEPRTSAHGSLLFFFSLSGILWSAELYSSSKSFLYCLTRGSTSFSPPI